MTKTYTPPSVWRWRPGNGGEFANINRPTAGATHESVLPKGKHPFQLYSMGTPNGVKVSILFEELLAAGHSEADYDAHLIDISKGDQFGSEFVAVNPNSKIPALLDYSGSEPVRVFESGAILLYLAEKFDAFLPKTPNGRVETLSWLFWQVGSAPYLGGGFGHFYAYAPEKNEYAIDRFTMEVKRQLDVLDKQLENNAFIVGDDYSIADMAVWPWYGALVDDKLYGAARFLEAESYKHILRWSRDIISREPVRKGRLVNRTWGIESQQLHHRHSHSDFDDKDITTY